MSNQTLRLLRRVTLVCSAAFVLSGCATTIPVTDDTPPEITLTITGPGIGTRRMSNPPRQFWAGVHDSQLFDLLPGESYAFTLAVSDEGGVQIARLRMPDELTITGYSPADVRRDTGPISQTLKLTGIRSDPRTGLVISGTFRTPDAGDALAFEFYTDGFDFGGRSGGTPNHRIMRVNVTVGAL